jgi:hypothetical protein
MARALRKVSAPVTRSRRATLGLEKKLMEKFLKNKPGMEFYAALRYNRP